MKHVGRHLSAHHHGELSAEEHLRVGSHLLHCSKCRAAYDEIRLGARLASSLSVTTAPAFTWRELRPGRGVTRRSRWVAPIAVGALAVVIFAVIFGRGRIPDESSWKVSGVPGMPRLRPGEVLQTGSSSEAEIQIANIGRLTMDPNTKIRLLITRADQHRIAVDRGKVEALTWAPPRLFIVETPTATAIDLGCKYTLEVEDNGSSLLHVTLGAVALEHEGRETLVPAGAFCHTRSGSGPGTPFFEDSSAPFQSALRSLDFGRAGTERARQLEIVLREARVRDGLSLWHLLPRLEPELRAEVYDRLAQLLPPPSNVNRDGIVALDPKMLDAWKNVVSQLWQ